MEIYEVTAVFTRELLGTVPKNKEIYRDHIQKKAIEAGIEVDNGEIETVDEMEEKGWTGFHVRDGRPFLYDYTIKGFFKDACGMLRRVTGSKSAGLKNFKKVIDGLVFVSPKEIPLVFPDNMGLTTIERPLRAQTAKGERVALAISDAAPAGTRITFWVKILGGVSRNVFDEWLEYGTLRGMGQWRNAGYGSFESAVAKIDGTPT